MPDGYCNVYVWLMIEGREPQRVTGGNFGFAQRFFGMMALRWSVMTQKPLGIL